MVLHPKNLQHPTYHLSHSKSITLWNKDCNLTAARQTIAGLLIGFRININILCSKLESYGIRIRDPLLSWLYAYLSDKRQIVKLRNQQNNASHAFSFSQSKPFEALSGVIQGGHLCIWASL